ncbi:related to MAM3 Protein required for normal mitochondrial morphology [Rhynchosporium graminicola]|uniref:Related to MAM3 Protein required for normal mitochondrial morphology n=1 Tax=Rhynchosporium graminicola TaxID=2792576 RepID=A0A1E1KJ66_9HELO|nr:related to MAM3 Protein required for normal mitochondrial morphology [Rhynchosporium commune]
MASYTAITGRQSAYHVPSTRRPAAAGIAKVILLVLAQVSHVVAAPLKEFLGLRKEDHDHPDAGDGSLWLYLTVAGVLVLLGGAFAGLTIALMGQDGVYLQVIATSGEEGKERRHAQKVLNLLQKGKHWVLVTLLLSNVIVNETLPIVLDRSLGGGWPAVLGSTILIVIFGEVIPQSICVRYGLSIGSFMAPPVLWLMWIMAPIAWPTAKLLDYMLGEDHGQVYKKSGLKTLVTLHKTLGTSPTERLNQDEVTIISAVLDLKEKAVGDIMTPMEDVFTMSADTVLDEKTMDNILSAGYSRIPIYEPGNKLNFVGMLLVKILITYDPEDCKKVSEFALATLPETRPETSCLDIVNFFQEGKSHMVMVSEFPGENFGAIGVVTLEDVIEELIGEEIIDESDVYIDVHKAIRRMAPAPKAKAHRNSVSNEIPIVHMPEDQLIDFAEEQEPTVKNIKAGDTLSEHIAPTNYGTSPKTTFLRRSSSGMDGNTIAVRGNMNDMREHLKHLGPSNLASRPKSTRYNTVKIKSALGVRSDSRTGSSIVHEPVHEEHYLDHPSPAPQGGEGEGLLNNAGKEASDGVHALQQGYGSFKSNSPSRPFGKQYDGKNDENEPLIRPQSRPDSPDKPVTRLDSHDSQKSSDTLTSLRSTGSLQKIKGTTRSGSITENIIEAGGIRKVILETTSSSSGDEPPKFGERAGNESSEPNQNESNSKKTIPKPKSKSKPKLSPGTSKVQSEHSDAQAGEDEDDASGAGGGVTGEQVKKKRRRTRKKKAKGGEEGSNGGAAAA